MCLGLSDRTRNIADNAYKIAQHLRFDTMADDEPNFNVPYDISQQLRQVANLTLDAVKADNYDTKKMGVRIR